MDIVVTDVVISKVRKYYELAHDQSVRWEF